MALFESYERRYRSAGCSYSDHRGGCRRISRDSVGGAPVMGVPFLVVGRQFQME